MSCIEKQSKVRGQIVGQQNRTARKSSSSTSSTHLNSLDRLSFFDHSKTLTKVWFGHDIETEPRRPSSDLDEFSFLPKIPNLRDNQIDTFYYALFISLQCCDWKSCVPVFSSSSVFRHCRNCVKTISVALLRFFGGKVNRSFIHEAHRTCSSTDCGYLVWIVDQKFSWSRSYYLSVLLMKRLRKVKSLREVKFGVRERTRQLGEWEKKGKVSTYLPALWDPQEW